MLLFPKKKRIIKRRAKSNMKNKILCLLLVCFSFINTYQAYAQERIKGKYGGDLKIRARNGLIEEAALKNYNFGTVSFKKIAVVYWKDYGVSKSKIGFTIFENITDTQTISDEFYIYADSLIKMKFEAFTGHDFDFLPVSSGDLSRYFKISKTLSFNPFQITPHGKNYLSELAALGYDGVFLLYEDTMPELFTGSKIWLPSKGLFKFKKKELVYHGLYSKLINCNNYKIVNNIGYLQLSADYYKGENFNSLSNYNNVLEDLKIRFENNINEIIRVHKLK